VPSITPELIRNCRRCGHELALGALACEQCHALVHGEELARLSEEAHQAEAKGELRNARDLWLKGLPLLPGDSRQAVWIRNHAQKLDEAAQQVKVLQQKPPAENQQWARKLGPLAPIAILLAKGKALLPLLKLKFLLSLFAFMGFYWAEFGAKFGIGFAVLILIHELGHFIDIQRRGLPADMPIFLPGLGAYVKWRALGVSVKTRAEVSLAGPLAGWVASVACGLIWWKTGDGLWAALARAGAWLNVMNMIPVWVLDGGQAALALSKTERLMIVIVSAVLGLVVHENVFYLVAAGAGWRLFTKDLPAYPSRSTAIYFAGVLACLGGILWLMPGSGFGQH
jgi:Zn-dependent protease